MHFHSLGVAGVLDIKQLMKFLSVSIFSFCLSHRLCMLVVICFLFTLPLLHLLLISTVNSFFAYVFLHSLAI